MLTQAVDRRHAPAAALLARWLWDRTRDPALEGRLRAGAEVDDETRAALAELLVATGRRGEARKQLELGTELGEYACWLPLGNLLCGDDLGDGSDLEGAVDLAAAQEAYRSGIVAGDLYCHHKLAMLLLDTGDTAGADAHLLAGATGGDEKAQRAWQRLHDDAGR